MCIAVITTAHPEYPFILLDNRDEYLSRPTAAARWWDSPSSQVLGGFDLYHKAHGTWLGITRQGRVAVLTNYREENQPILPSGRSRGEVVNGWLESPPSQHIDTEHYARHVVENDGGVQGMGGFSLMYGRIQDVIKTGTGLAILSNRTPDVKGLIWLAQKPGETRAMSNSFFGDVSWPKVTNCEHDVGVALSESAKKKEPKEELIKRLFAVLSKGDLRSRKKGEDWEVYLRQLRNTIFVPTIGGSKLSENEADEVTTTESPKAVDTSPGVYGTQKQTIILVNRDGHADFVERTLFDVNSNAVPPGQGDRHFEFDIEGW
ncbi:DUF833-domain-containing protein [Pseudovirgaria hyperparasitica]|uniref:DUF833-domain-containing protein n=1 Tax=Pseudovirgaria hyperparasitica TaxID=470096 RepID=A0A6A6WGN7_9PEZI|nr:DUF833-domain-containing protein [Pseudovirgaria hyperparasitica]KAF2761265.1 DUF833-domain-containing protein [Pseudovirgaria hyperparasitica]